MYNPPTSQHSTIPLYIYSLVPRLLPGINDPRWRGCERPGDEATIPLYRSMFRTRGTASDREKECVHNSSMCKVFPIIITTIIVYIV